MQENPRVTKPARLLVILLFIALAVNLCLQLFDFASILGKAQAEAVESFVMGAGMVVLCIWFFGGYITECLHRYNNQ